MNESANKKQNMVINYLIREKWKDLSSGKAW